MLTSPPTAAGRAPRGRGTAGGPGDDPRGRLPAAKRLQGQRSARPSRGGGRSPQLPAAASEAEQPSAPTSSPRRPRPRLPLRPGHAPSERGALWELWSRAAARGPPAGRRGRGPREPGNYNCGGRSASPGPWAPRRPMRQDHEGLQNKRRWRGERSSRPAAVSAPPSPGGCSWKPGREGAAPPRPVRLLPNIAQPPGFGIRQLPTQMRNQWCRIFDFRAEAFSWFVQCSVASHLLQVPYKNQPPPPATWREDICLRTNPGWVPLNVSCGQLGSSFIGQEYSWRSQEDETGSLSSRQGITCAQTEVYWGTIEKTEESNGLVRGLVETNYWKSVTSSILVFPQTLFEMPLLVVVEAMA
ncbi:translation initiation factor IF-2-like isoform X1 [Felis catus]|uniref:translation initiation factor IF-2-like isoform X1 n=1 Tax=Felis catus TaxID=9685 RepID=UPI001D1A1317|nr:translation initiation factor IF-2-like isoform X1 [Felis catus]